MEEGAIKSSGEFLRQPKDGQPELGDQSFDPTHGLICQLYCSCPLNQNDIPLKSDYKQLVFHHLRRGMNMNAEAETMKFLTKKNFQDLVFQSVIESLSRREMHRFLKLVSPEHQKSRGNEGWCISFKREEGKKNFIDGGRILVDDETYSLHQILFKFFRPHVHFTSLEGLILTSRKDCKMSKNSSSGCTVFCINPWHFERTDSAITSMIASTDHKCETRLRVSHDNAFFVCPYCQQNRKLFYSNELESVEHGSPGPSTASTAAASEEEKKSENQNPTDNDVIVKKELQEIADESEDDSIRESIAELNDDFEKSLGSYEKQVMSETIKEEEEEEEPERMEVTLVLDGDDANVNCNRNVSFNIQPKSTVGASSPSSSINYAMLDITKKRRRESMFRCWKCLNWYKKQDLRYHSCLPKLLNDSLFCCHFCAACSPDLESMTEHVGSCKAFGLKPIPELARKSDDAENSRSRAKRAKKSDDDNTRCSECAITFANSGELILHSEKSKCRSIQCAMCNRFYANSRTHQNHECELVDAEGKNEGIVVLKVDEKDHTKMPMKCQDCKLLLRSYPLLKRHQSGPVLCPMCKDSFPTMCILLLHACSKKAATL